MHKYIITSKNQFLSCIQIHINASLCENLENFCSKLWLLITVFEATRGSQRSIVFFLTFHQTFSRSNRAPTPSFTHRGSFRHAENNYSSHVKESTAPRQKWQRRRRRADIRAGSTNLHISQIFMYKYAQQDLDHRLYLHRTFELSAWPSVRKPLQSAMQKYAFSLPDHTVLSQPGAVDLPKNHPAIDVGLAYLNLKLE